MASGRVEIMGTIDLMEFLRPWSIAQAIAAPETCGDTIYGPCRRRTRPQGPVSTQAYVMVREKCFILVMFGRVLYLK